MKNVLLIISTYVFLFLVQSCCKGKSQTYHSTLKPGDEKFIPYQLGQQIQFKHSAGSYVLFTVAERFKAVDETEGSGGGMFTCSNFFINESETVKIVSSAPTFEILLYMYGNEEEKKSSFRISTLNTGFHFPRPYDICTTGGIYKCHDSVMLLNKKYYHVYEISPDTSELRTNILRASSIMYNTEHGILKIELSNKENYTIVK